MHGPWDESTELHAEAEPEKKLRPGAKMKVRLGSRTPFLANTYYYNGGSRVI